MKILVSSKSLYSVLDSHIIDHNSIKSAKLQGDCLILHHFYTPIVIEVEVLEAGPEVCQYGARWNWLKKTLSKVPEQPVTLEIKEDIVNLIFQF